MFYARVELHKPNDTPANYQLLHQKMEAIGFSRFIIGEGAKKFALPTGMYCNDNQTIATVQIIGERVAETVKSITTNAEAIVVESGPARYFNLKPA